MKKLITVLLTLSTSCLFASSIFADEGKMEVENFVKQMWIHGTPIAQAATYGKEDVSELIDLLEETDDSDDLQLSNIVTVLSVIGTDKAVDAVIKFSTTASANEDSADPFFARDAATKSLGYAAGKSEKALNFLINSLQAGVTGQDSFKTPAERKQNADIRESTIIALALSGASKAADALMNHQNNLDLASDNSLLTNDFISLALTEHALVASMGIEAYSEQEVQ